MKSKTHIYMANLLLDDLTANRIELPENLGSFTPPQEIRDAILANPDEFRAGAIGPDFYPDMQVGQTVIHPTDSGKWLELMFEEFALISVNDPERKKALSFLMGFMMHYSADLYGHEYVNSWAKGWFPEYSEALADPEKMKKIIRHVLVESYMDTKVPAGTNYKLAFPIKFLKNCFMSKKALEWYKSGSKIALLFGEKTRMYAFNKSQNSTTNMLDIVNYFKSWEKDVSRGIQEWFNAWHAIAQIMVTEGKSIKDAGDVLNKWATDYLAYMSPAPDFIADFVKLIDSLNILKPIKEAIKKEINRILMALVKAATGVDVQDVLDEIKKMFKDPALYLNNGILYEERNVTELLDAEFGNFGNCTSTSSQTFIAFQQCLNMGKLCLLGPDNLNKLIQTATGKKVTPFQNMLCTGALESLSIRIKTKGRSFWNFTTGTDDNVYFGVILQNSECVELLLDKPGYNDFEAGDNDTYGFVLPERINYKDVKAFRLRKDYINISDDWTPESITVTDQTGRPLLNTGLNVTLKGRTPFDIPVNLNGYAANQVLQMDHKVISFLYSLDGAGENDKNNPTSDKQWKDENNIFYNDTDTRIAVYNKLFDFSKELVNS